MDIAIAFVVGSAVATVVAFIYHSKVIGFLKRQAGSVDKLATSASKKLS